MTFIDPNLIDLSQAADTQQAKQVIVQGAAVGTLVCVQEALEKLGVESTIEEFRVRYLISDMEVGAGDKKLHFARLRVGNNIWDGKLRTARGWQEAFVDDFPKKMFGIGPWKVLACPKWAFIRVACGLKFPMRRHRHFPRDWNANCVD